MATKTIIITAIPTSRGGNTLAIRKIPVAVAKQEAPKLTMIKPPPTIVKPPPPRIIATPAVQAKPVQHQPIASPAIILRPPKRPIDEEWDEEENEPQSPHPVRKRERLTGMSIEEKVHRRKMKNRIAAQTARDRKKAKMGDLEELVQRLESENEALQYENAKLRHKTGQLSAENGDLKKQLKESERKDSGEKGAPSSVALGSAASINGPLPWEQTTKKASVSLGSILTTLTLLFKLFSEKSSKTRNSSLPLKALNANWNLDNATADKLALKLEQLERLLEARRKRAGMERPP